eukprot:jgi/Psemu1/27928/gm1.27928_g
MNGIVIDNSGQTTLTLLNMTLVGITLTRNSPQDAWETIKFHPTGTHDKGDKLIGNVSNLHPGLCAVLSSLKDACNLMDVAYFIGDTPQHDQLCGHYQTANTKMICRHCNCPRALGNNALTMF